MKVGDVVKLIDEPTVDWMEDYLDKTFQVLGFPSEIAVELMMLGTEPRWVWMIEKCNLQLVKKPLTAAL